MFQEMNFLAKFHKDLLVLMWVWVWGFFLCLGIHRFGVFGFCREGKSWDLHLDFIFWASEEVGPLPAHHVLLHLVIHAGHLV